MNSKRSIGTVFSQSASTYFKMRFLGIIYNGNIVSYSYLGNLKRVVLTIIYSKSGILFMKIKFYINKRNLLSVLIYVFNCVHSTRNDLNSSQTVKNCLLKNPFFLLQRGT